MWGFVDLIENFFTHKDFLPPANQIPGTLFTPLQWVFSAICVFLVVFLSYKLSKRGEKAIQRIFAVIWVMVVILEPTKIIWETVSGTSVRFEWGGILPLYPCSIFLYALPFVIWGKGEIRRAAAGYVCTLGFIGGVVNFVYPVNILSNYSCLSFAGFHTLFYHGAIVFCALTMLMSCYHSFGGVTKWWQLLTPSVPLLVVSVVANSLNFSSLRTDYMFFRLNSFIFTPIGEAIPDGLEPVAVYIVYILIHALPYLPSYISNRRSESIEKNAAKA